MNRSHFSRAAGALMLATLASVWVAPSAHAQLGGGIGDAVGNAGGSVLDSGSGVVGGVTDSLEGGSNGSQTDSDTTTDDGGGGGGLVGGVVGTIEKTVENSKETVTEVTETTSDTVGNVGSGTIEGVVGSVAGTVEGTVGKVDKDSPRDGRKQRTARTPVTITTSTDTAKVLGNSFADALRSDARDLKLALARSTETSSVSSPVNQSVIQQIGKIAAEAVKQAAFPVALILLVVGFLMIQNRMDSRDPKLALAPVDSQHDSLSFT